MFLDLKKNIIEIQISPKLIYINVIQFIPTRDSELYNKVFIES